MQYHQPTDLDQALRLLADFDGRLIAGGTDIFPSASQGKRPGNLIDLTAIDGLSDITVHEDSIRIGAAVTWSKIAKANLSPAFDGFKQAAKEIGSVQIQNAGTIAGNLCNASPAADGVPPLLALDAFIEVAGRDHKTHQIRLADFILGVRKTALNPHEIVTAIIIPTPDKNERSAFDKLGSRKYLVISISMVAANIKCDNDGLIRSAKIAIGACSPVAQRMAKLEKTIVNMSPHDVKVLPEHLSLLSPIDDVRGSKHYRLDVVAEQCERVIRRAAGCE